MDDKKLADRIIKARLRKGISTQEEVAHQLGVSRQAYLNYETGVVSPKASMLQKMAEIFDCNPGWLLAGEGDPNHFDADIEAFLNEHSGKKQSMSRGELITLALRFLASLPKAQLFHIFGYDRSDKLKEYIRSIKFKS